MPHVKAGDIETYYEEAGSGDPLVLVCGISAELQVWRFQVEALEKAAEMMAANPYAQKPYAFLRQADALLAYEGVDASRLRAPTLVMVGADDNLLPPYLSERLAQAIPGAALKVMKGAHGGFLEFPEDYNREIADFLS